MGKRNFKNESHGRYSPPQSRAGKLELLERIEFPEGKEITVRILDVPWKTDDEAFDRSADGWRKTIDAKKLIKIVYSDGVISTRLKTTRTCSTCRRGLGCVS